MTGTGTEADPYVITTLTDLQNMNNDLDAYYVLGNDIDASGTAAWNGGLGFAPIGDSATPFTGNFDGKGYTITGLTVNRPTEAKIGLFGYVEPPTASSLVIQNVTLASCSITGRYSVGALLGEVDDPFSCDSLLIANCSSSGAVEAADGTAIGGLIGEIYLYQTCAVIIKDCHSSCAVMSSDSMAGGLVGYATSYGPSSTLSVQRCYATGAVSCKDSAGGLLGDATGVDGRWESLIIEQCYSTGNVVTSNNIAGGSIGYAEYIHIRDCYARGNSTGDGSHDGTSGTCGGFVGYTSDASFENCYSTGIASADEYVGGFVGYSYPAPYAAVYSGCAWDTDTSGTMTACGSGAVTGVTGYTTAEMKDGTATEGWSVADWDLITASNNGYACLLGITPGCIAPTTPNTIGDRSVVIEKPVLELIRNVEVQLDGRFYIDKNGNAVYESRFHRSG